MSSFQLDDNGDLQVIRNQITLTEGAEAVRQHLQCKLRLFRGEWFLDTTAGVPWFQEVLQKQPSFVVVQQVLKDTILSTPGVIGLLKFKFDYEAPSREAFLDFQALTDEGPIDFSQIIEV